MKRFLRLCLAVAGLVLLPWGIFLGAGAAGALFPAEPDTGRAPGAGERIYLLTTLLHADIALPLDDDLRQRYSFLGEDGLPLDHPNARYLIFGWGSKAFYTTARTLTDIRPGPLYKAVTGDEAVMHVYVGSDVTVLPNAQPVILPPGGTRRLLRFIGGAFEGGAGDPAHMPGFEYGPTDAFYAGTGRFNLLRPCNIWVAEALQAAGLKTGRWTPTTHSLLLGLRYHSPEAMAR